MKTFFKTALVAAAIATACGSAYAGDTEVSTKTFSLEGVGSVTVDQTSNAISYVTKAAYALNDKITFAFTAGAVKSSAAFPAQLNVDAVTGRAGMALGLLNTTADSVTYRVTSVNQFGSETGNTTLGATIVLGTATLKATSVVAGDISVTVSSETSGKDVLDSGSSTNKSRTAKLTQVKTEFGTVSVSPVLNGVIDVAADRKGFTVGTNDALTFAVSQINTTSWSNVVGASATTVTLDADLAGFDLTKSVGSVSTGSTSTVTYDDAAKKVTIKYATPVTTDTVTITPPTTTKAVVLNAQDFKLAATHTYSSTKTADLGAKAAGSWTLNGAMVNVPYMPYGATIDQIIYVTNTGSLDAAVNVTAFDEAGTDYDLGQVATAKKGTVTKLAGAIETALEAKGFAMSGKLSLTITVNAQDKDISVYSAYNVGGSDRGNVINSQYKGK